ncbi:hypothetical protein BDV93DRAFT_289768 [Ceratobasidium sp. AG-I]|nr:hypothetical protein BDV93DRAFT_289768 [Ceratobasidium sp. AG-I]
MTKLWTWSVMCGTPREAGNIKPVMMMLLQSWICIPRAIMDCALLLQARVLFGSVCFNWFEISGFSWGLHITKAGNPLIAGPPPPPASITKNKRSGGDLTLTAAPGHVNGFEELGYSYHNKLEHNPKPRTKADADKAFEREPERGVPLMPGEKDRN